MTTHESTQEEIEKRRAEIEASMCPGDGVHTDTMRWHDWRLWSRKPYSLEGQINGRPMRREFDESAYFALTDPPPAEWREVWYCTRCRKIEERTVMLDGS